MNEPVLSTALGALGSGAPMAAVIHAVLLDPGSSQQAEIWFRLDRGTPFFAWSPDLGRPASSSASVVVSASLTQVSGAKLQVFQAIFKVGERWELTGRRPFTVWALPFDLDWRDLEEVLVTLGISDPQGGLANPIEISLSPTEPPVRATLLAARQQELAFEILYRRKDGGTLTRQPAPVTDLFLEVPSAPSTATLRVDLEAPFAASLDVQRVDATLVEAAGTEHKNTWSPGNFGQPWTLHLPAQLGSEQGDDEAIASGRLSYRVTFAPGTVPEYISPEAPVFGPEPIRLGFFGAARFTVVPETFEQVKSVEVEVIAPTAGSSGPITADNPIGWVALPGSVDGAPTPGEDFVLAWQAVFDLSGGNTTVLDGSGVEPAVILDNPIAVKTFSFLPVWVENSARRIQLSYRSLEQAAEWQIESAKKSVTLTPGDGVVAATFPVVDAARALVIFGGRVITGNGSQPIPETFVAGESIAIGEVEPWLSVSVDPSLVDWQRFSEVLVELSHGGQPPIVGELRFDSRDGLKVWGFFGASVASRVYDVKATYRSLGGESVWLRLAEKAERLTLPRTPQSEIRELRQ